MLELDDLEITLRQLEKLTGLDIGPVFVSGMIRPSALRSPRHWRSLFITEGLLLLAAWIACLGLGLVIMRSVGNRSLIPLLIIASGGVLAGTTMCPTLKCRGAITRQS